MLFFNSILLLVGFLILFKSADQFVIGSVATANNLKISPMIVGLTVVALGTSAPEIFVAIAASLSGQPDLAVGNAIGSNIANLGMVLGITAIIVPLPFKSSVLKHDLPIMAGVAVVAGLCLYDLELNLWDGLILLGCFIAFLVRIAMDGKLSNETVVEMEELEDIPEMSTPKAVLILVLSLVFLLISAEILVHAVVEIATQMGVSELMIGLTVIAVGTSLPELVVSVTSAVKGQTELAIGNILGSNIFNILTVMTIPALLAPATFESGVFWRDYGLMMGMTTVMLIFAYGIRSTARITRPEGFLLVGTWIAYLVYLYQTAVA